MPDLNQQKPAEYKNRLAQLLQQHLNERNWNYADLSRKSGVSTATITRILRLRENDERLYQPKPQTIHAIALALMLGISGYNRLLNAAYPGWEIWQESINLGRSLMQTNEILYDNGLPILGDE